MVNNTVKFISSHRQPNALACLDQAFLLLIRKQEEETEYITLDEQEHFPRDNVIDQQNVKCANANEKTK